MGMNKCRKAGDVPDAGQKLRLFRWKDGVKQEGWTITGKKAPGGGAAFVVDRFTVQAYFGTESYPETYYCDEHGTSWLYADE
jgi:hypothetical protein